LTSGKILFILEERMVTLLYSIWGDRGKEPEGIYAFAFCGKKVLSGGTDGPD
jgi:hypothetical protein